MSAASRPTLVTFFFLGAAAIAAACRGCDAGPGAKQGPDAATPAAANFLLITVDTLRADAVGAYGSAARRTPALDALAAEGVRFDAAFAPAPITLPSHASLLTGLYPPGHGSRHNGIAVRADVPTLATVCEKAGLSTAAFVSAFPLDRRFGLARGFGEYGDRLPRPAGGRPLNERPGSATVDEAIAWLQAGAGLKTGPSKRFFLWVHLFEPHAPYGNPRDGRPAFDRYMDEVAEADRQIGRLIDALGPARAATLVAVAGDHGEAFGEHGEIGHSIFIYDTTLRVPLVMAGSGVARGVVTGPVSLVDVAPTALARLGLPALDADGVDLGGSQPTAPSSRTLYTESFAPLLDFGWSALRSVRRDGWKYIAAPRPELFNVASDPDEAADRARDEPARAAELEGLTSRIAGPDLPRDARTSMDPEAERRLRALGYIGGAGPRTGPRPDPKDRRELAARLARVTSGELEGDALRSELEAILREDEANPQAHMRLGYVLAEAGRCPDAERHFKRAIALRLPSADPYLGLAGCQAGRGDRKAAIGTLEASANVEADNPVVLANIGSLRSELGDHAQAISALSKSVSIDPDFHQARFYLALAYAGAGQRENAAREARTLLERLPPNAPQRSEVDRLLRAVLSR
jgi:arylsulfatase A-like enzyme/Flp pilus assembly protein TadD